MSKGSDRRPENAASFDTAYEKIFGVKAPERGSWVYCSVREKLIPKSEYQPIDKAGYHIQADIEPFISPITGKEITSRSQLRRHNKEHGVTNSKDYSKEYLLKRSQERNAEMLGETKAAKRERVELLKQELDQRGIH